MPPPSLLPYGHPQMPLPFLPPAAERSYRDLDEPGPDSDKNPWGGLAMNWGKKETQPCTDYQAMLLSHAVRSSGKQGREVG